MDGGLPANDQDASVLPVAHLARHCRHCTAHLAAHRRSIGLRAYQGMAGGRRLYRKHPDHGRDDRGWALITFESGPEFSGEEVPARVYQAMASLDPAMPFRSNPQNR